jgi:hypothetical protein
MNQGTKWVLLMQKNRRRKCHAWAPLNSEKLAKSSNVGAQMTDICKDNGETFEHDIERKSYTMDYFSVCYKC